MIILKEQIEPQELKFIPREMSADTIVLRNETTNEIVTYYTADLIYNFKNRVLLDNGIFENIGSLITAFNFTDAHFEQDNYYLKTSIELDLKEDTFYNLIVLNGSSIVYRDKIFCTNQTKSDFTVNENTYVENNIINEFIIYE